MSYEAAVRDFIRRCPLLFGAAMDVMLEEEK